MVTDLRLSFQGEQNILSVILWYTASLTGETVQLLLTLLLRRLISTQMLVESAHIGPGHRTLVVVPVQQGHSYPTEGRHQRCGADLAEDCPSAYQLPPSAQLGPVLAQTCQQLPRLLTQDVTQQQHSQSGHQQEHQAVDEVQLTAGTTEHC